MTLCASCAFGCRGEAICGILLIIERSWAHMRLMALPCKFPEGERERPELGSAAGEMSKGKREDNFGAMVLRFDWEFICRCKTLIATTLYGFSFHLGRTSIVSEKIISTPRV